MKLKLRILLSTAFVLCLMVGAFAQNIQFKGKVNNKATGENLAGATIIVKGTKQSTVSDQNGQFVISIPTKGASLVVSFVGMTSIERFVNASSKTDFLLELSNSNNLDEVIVVGYGSQKITKVSGAISTIKSADIEKINAVRTEEALQGRAAGVNVIQGGSPGSKPTV
jgi:hypothetical protein